MCGIAGIYQAETGEMISRALVTAMADALHHRGPDQGGVHIEPRVGLGHRRLSIIDINHGAQPFKNPAGTITLVYNGEIYNFQELKSELQKAGHIFQTNCDTEVVLQAWERWGEQCVERFRGMFAFALWDRERQTFFLARDRLGIKPLYYGYLPDGTLLFGSELKALLVHPKLAREPDPFAVEDYLAYGYVPDPRTIIKNVYKLAPGHVLVYRRGQTHRPEPRAYWDISFNQDLACTESEAAETLRDKLKEAVDIRLVADVPLGAFLSGGVDSSAVVAMMAKGASDPVSTCSIAFQEQGFDESAYAERVAKLFGTSHHQRTVSAEDHELIDMLTGIYDEPFADSSAMPTYRVCQLARERVTVALSGDGGDETFAGYRRHLFHANESRVRALLPGGVRRPLFGALARVYPKADWAPQIFRAKSTFQSLARDTAAGYFHAISFINDDTRDSIYSDSFKRRLQGYGAFEVFRRHAQQAPTDDALSLAQYLDMKTYLPGDILTKVDRASMANSLEVRVPILDHEFVQWASSLPNNLKLRGREGKYILKKSLEDRLPAEILYRKKMGFSIPLAKWFRGPLRERIQTAALDETLADTGIFEQARLQKLVDQHQRGQRDNSTALWSLLMLDAWFRNLNSHHTGSAPEHAAAAPLRYAALSGQAMSS